jgi:hypothetical protein
MNVFNAWFWNPTVEAIKKDFKHISDNVFEPSCTFLVDPDIQTMLLGRQGITGKALRICKQPIAVKISSIPQSFWFSDVSKANLYNGPEPTSLAYSANYEELVLRMVTKLVKDKICSHFVCLLDSKLCSVTNMLPEMSATAIAPSRKSYLETIQKTWNEMVRFPVPKDTRKDHKEAVFNLAASFLELLKKAEARTCIIFAMLLSNYYQHMIFPAPDPELLASHVFYWKAFYYSSDSIRTICRRMMTRQHDGLIKVISELWKKNQSTFRALENASNKITSVNFRYRHYSVLSSRLWNFQMRILVSKFANGGAVEDFITNNWMFLKEVDYRVLYFQVFYALYCLAVKYPGFRHNDLHTYNVLLEISQIEVPNKRISKTRTGSYKIDIKERKKNFTQQSRPYRLKKKNYKKTTRYYVAGKTFYIPDRGFEVKIWDYDLSNMCAKNPLNKNHVVSNTKAEGLHLTAKDTYYDITFFINCMQFGLFRYKRSKYFKRTKKTLDIFPKRIQSFHKQVLQEAVDNRKNNPKVNRPFSYRLKTNYHKPNKIFDIMDTAIKKGGLFHTFLYQPANARISSTFRI